MAISKIKTAGIGILIALLIGTTGIVAVKEIQKKQAPGASEKPDIVASPSKQEVHDQPKSSENDEPASAKLETKDKAQSAKVKQPPKARNFKAEIEEELARLPEVGYPNIEAIMREWLVYDKDEAIEWTLRMTGPQRTHLFTIVASVWAEKDPVAASEWAMELPEDFDRESAFIQVASVWALKDPVAASEWVMKLPEGQGSDNAFRLVASIWAVKDPVAASEWVMKLPEGNGRYNALMNVALNWAVKDPVAAYECVMRQSNFFSVKAPA